MADFPHKIWAHPDHRAKYDEAVARVKAVNPDAKVPSHLDPRGLDHVLGILSAMEPEVVKKKVKAEDKPA